MLSDNSSDGTVAAQTERGTEGTTTRASTQIDDQLTRYDTERQRC